MKFRYASLLGLALSAQVAHGQVSIGPEVGFNVSNYLLTNNNASRSSAVKLGGIIGFVVEEQLTNHLYLQQGLSHFTNGYATDWNHLGTQISTVYIIRTLEVPVMLNYKLYMPADDHNRWTVGAGPYVGYNWEATQRTKSGNIDSKNDLPMGNGINDSMRRLDIGARIQGGYQLAEGFYVRAHYQMGFANLASYRLGGTSKYSYNFGISIGFLLSRNRNCAKAEKEHKVKEEKKQAAALAPEAPLKSSSRVAPALQKRTISTYDK